MWVTGRGPDERPDLNLARRGGGSAVQEVRGTVGGAVQIKCNISTSLQVKGFYFQKKNLSGSYEILVNGFYTSSVEGYLRDEYRNRTRVNKTDHSLDLWNLKASDEGHYKCFFIPQDLLKDYDTIFHLTVTAADYSIPTVTVQECSDHGEGVLSCELGCWSFGGYPLANLNWTVLEGGNEVLHEEGSMSTVDKHSGVWNVSQSVRLNCTRPTTVSCSVGGAISPPLSLCEKFWAKYTEKRYHLKAAKKCPIHNKAYPLKKGRAFGGMSWEERKVIIISSG
ncbi:hypothetical protein AOLI_G00326570 [Acnodon oligacanthus]